MNFTVVWLPHAEDELSAVWVASARRDDVTAAAAELDRRLAHDPVNEGEARPDGRRVTLVSPLAAIFRVHPATRRVNVIRVWERV